MAKVSDRAVLVYQIERRSRSDCVHEQVAKRIANVRFTTARQLYCMIQAWRFFRFGIVIHLLYFVIERISQR